MLARFCEFYRSASTFAGLVMTCWCGKDCFINGIDQFSAACRVLRPDHHFAARRLVESDYIRGVANTVRFCRPKYTSGPPC